MPQFCNPERMLGFGSPGDTGMSAAVRRRTLPLGKFSHLPALAVAGIALPFPGQGRGARGHSRGLENSASLEALRHFPWHSATNNDAARPRSDRKMSAGAFGFRKFSIRGMLKPNTNTNTNTNTNKNTNTNINIDTSSNTSTNTNTISVHIILLLLCRSRLPLMSQWQLPSPLRLHVHVV